MKAKVIKIIEQEAKSNALRASKCYIICFKTDDGKIFRTWTDDAMGNFRRWYSSVIVGFFQCQKDRRELWLDGLVVKAKGLVDGDSLFKVEIIAAPEEAAAVAQEEAREVKQERVRKDLE